MSRDSAEPPNQRAEACGSVALELQQSPYLFICPDCNRANRVVITLSHEGLLVYAVYNKPFLPERPLDTLNFLSLAQFPSQSPVAQNLSTLST
jgi:hypothetical protein